LQAKLWRRTNGPLIHRFAGFLHLREFVVALLDLVPLLEQKTIKEILPAD